MSTRVNRKWCYCGLETCRSNNGCEVIDHADSQNRPIPAWDCGLYERGFQCQKSLDIRSHLKYAFLSGGMTCESRFGECQESISLCQVCKDDIVINNGCKTLLCICCTLCVSQIWCVKISVEMCFAIPFIYSKSLLHYRVARFLWRRCCWQLYPSRHLCFYEYLKRFYFLISQLCNWLKM